MSQDRSELLQARLDQNYRDYLAQLREKPFDEIIKLAPEITAAQQLCGELLNACDDDDMEFLLQFDDPLEVVRGCWESEITGYSHKGEMGHMLWEIQDRVLYEKEQLAQPSEKALPSPVTPDNPAKPKIPLAYPGEDVYSVLRRAIKTLKEAGQQQEAAAMAFLVFSAKNPQDALTVLSNYVEIEPPHTPKRKTRSGKGKNVHER